MAQSVSSFSAIALPTSISESLEPSDHVIVLAADGAEEVYREGLSFAGMPVWQNYGRRLQLVPLSIPGTSAKIGAFPESGHWLFPGARLTPGLLALEAPAVATLAKGRAVRCSVGRSLADGDGEHPWPGFCPLFDFPLCQPTRRPIVAWAAGNVRA